MKDQFPYNKFTSEKLARYFAGEADPTEIAEIEEWAGQSAANRELLMQLQIVWIDTGHVRTADFSSGRKYDAAAAWEKVKAKKRAAVAKNSSTFALWKVAASIIILVGVGLLIRSYLSQPTEMVFLAEASSASLKLPDSSSVLLNKNSKLTYPGNLEGPERLVRLEGEAFFEVTHNPNKPFIVRAGNTQVKVLGTSFNIKITEATITVLVETGKVQFSSDTEDILLSAGQAAQYLKASSEIREEREANTYQADRYWRTKTLRFAGAKLPEVIETLEKVYNVNIRLAEDHLTDCSLSVTFQNDSLDNILDVISLTLNLQVETTEKEITLSGKGCIEN